jgi:tellurite resistance-related uncharacterized protein
MVLVQLNGGLGNQLFQYALGRRIACDRGVELRFDTGAFAIQKREYKLHHFNVKGSLASMNEIKLFTGREQNRWFSILSRLWNGKKTYDRRIIVDEQAVPFDEKILNVPENVFLRGYWQSEKYFKVIEPVLREDLTLKTPLTGLNLGVADQIRSRIAISLHVRRGDYFTDSATNQTHGTLSVEYYKAAADVILRCIPGAAFFVFSDDIPWVKENLNMKSPTIFVEHNTQKTDYEDLRLMSLCQHHIIANSSFSWWGAWLNPNKEKMVIAPKKWYSINVDTKDLIPEGWTLV